MKKIFEATTFDHKAKNTHEAIGWDGIPDVMEKMESKTKEMLKDIFLEDKEISKTSQIIEHLLTEIHKILGSDSPITPREVLIAFSFYLVGEKMAEIANLVKKQENPLIELLKKLSENG